MKYVDEFRDPQKAKRLAAAINELADKHAQQRQQPLQLMEFCGGHTHTIFRYGIEQLLPERIEMVHGPGCPVCVLPRGRVDDAVALAQQDNVIFTTFGDAMRVPGSHASLLEAKANGADVRMVYSPLDALQLAQGNPQKEVIFFALGFETTMPSTALTVQQAARQGVGNFSLFCNHVTTIPTIQAILDSPDVPIDGFLAPGHVSMVIGEDPFRQIAECYHKPIVITGFEPLDILQSIHMLLQQLDSQRSIVENQYRRVVNPDGNHPGLAAMQDVFEWRDDFELRGLGPIDHSGVQMRSDYATFDAEQRFSLPNQRVADPDACQCGEVLRGTIRPWECQLFGSTCNPQNPMGALMVSSEGACAAYHNFGNPDDLSQQRSHLANPT